MASEDVDGRPAKTARVSKDVVYEFFSVKLQDAVCVGHWEVFGGSLAQYYSLDHFFTSPLYISSPKVVGTRVQYSWL